MRKPTIYEIKRLTEETYPYFFSKDTLKFFGQKMKDFKVHTVTNSIYRISAPIRDYTGMYQGITNWYFYPETNTLSRELL